MTIFSREEEVRSSFSLIISIIFLIVAVFLGLFGNSTWIGLLIIAFAFAIPFLRIMIEQEM